VEQMINMFPKMRRLRANVVSLSLTVMGRRRYRGARKSDFRFLRFLIGIIVALVHSIAILADSWFNMRLIYSLPLWLGAIAMLGLALRADQPSPTAAIPLKQASAHGVSFDYPSDLALETELDDVSTKLNLKHGDRLPSILVQVYKVSLTPDKALEINVRHGREMCNRKGWPLTETPIQDQIGGKQCAGTEFLFTANEVQFRQRFLTAIVGKRTIFVMTLSKTVDDDLAQTLFKPVLSSIR